MKWTVTKKSRFYLAKISSTNWIAYAVGTKSKFPLGCRGLYGSFVESVSIVCATPCPSARSNSNSPNRSFHYSKALASSHDYEDSQTLWFASARAPTRSHATIPSVSHYLLTYTVPFDWRHVSCTHLVHHSRRFSSTKRALFFRRGKYSAAHVRRFDEFQWVLRK